MMSLNRITIIGNTTRDPELRTIASGQSVTSFSVATNYSYTDSSGQRQEKAEFHNVVAWGKLAEICSQFVTKGRKVYVEGRVQTREWEGQDGAKRNRTEIVAENVILLDRNPNGGAPGSFSRQSMPRNAEPAMATQSATQSADASQEGSNDEIRVEDIPF